MEKIKQWNYTLAVNLCELSYNSCVKSSYKLKTDFSVIRNNIDPCNFSIFATKRMTKYSNNGVLALGEVSSVDKNVPTLNRETY